MINFTYKYSDPLVIEMSKHHLLSFKTRLMPRGASRYHREWVVPTDGTASSSSWVKEEKIFGYTFNSPEPIKAFCVPPKDYYASMWAKEALVNKGFA